MYRNKIFYDVYYKYKWQRRNILYNLLRSCQIFFNDFHMGYRYLHTCTYVCTYTYVNLYYNVTYVCTYIKSLTQNRIISQVNPDRTLYTSQVLSLLVSTIYHVPFAWLFLFYSTFPSYLPIFSSNITSLRHLKNWYKIGNEYIICNM